MKGYLKIGDKIGYLNLRTGKYMYSTIVGMEGEGLFQMVGKVGKIANHYTEKVENVCKYLKTPSIDFADKKMLMKHKSVKN